MCWILKKKKNTPLNLECLERKWKQSELIYDSCDKKEDDSLAGAGLGRRFSYAKDTDGISGFWIRVFEEVKMIWLQFPTSFYSLKCPNILRLVFECFIPPPLNL